MLSNAKIMLAQTFVVNNERLVQIAQNYTYRTSVSASKGSLINSMDDNLNDVNAETAKFLIVKQHIFESLKNVNSALENSKQVIQMAQYVEQIVEFNTLSIEIAVDNPQLLLFTQGRINYMTEELAEMANSLYDIVLEENNELLMNYQARQSIINAIRNRLLIVRGMSRGLLSLLKFRASNTTTENILDTWFPEEQLLINNIMGNWNGIKM
jgi:hypothetical protein